MASVSSLAEPSLACTCMPGELLVAAQDAGVLINGGQISTSTSDLVAASSRTVGIENIPATQYAPGVDVAFVFLDSPDAHLPAGDHRLTATAKGSTAHWHVESITRMVDPVLPVTTSGQPSPFKSPKAMPLGVAPALDCVTAPNDPVPAPRSRLTAPSE
ncbi:hypothetical protein WA016_01334 [Myxococcus stipitatus]